jgi:hypothetical protein
MDWAWPNHTPGLVLPLNIFKSFGSGARAYWFQHNYPAYLTILTLGLLLGWDQIVQIYEGKVFSQEGLRQSSSGPILRSGGWRTW